MRANSASEYGHSSDAVIILQRDEMSETAASRLNNLDRLRQAGELHHKRTLDRYSVHAEPPTWNKATARILS
jgi:hypothetical protein